MGASCTQCETLDQCSEFKLMQKQQLYSVEVTEGTEDETPIYRNTLSQDFLYDKLHQENTLQYAMLLSFRNRNQNVKKCLASFDKNKDSFQWLSYSQVFNKVQEIGSAIIDQNLANVNNNVKGKQIQTVGVFSYNRMELALIDLVSVFYNISIVPFKHSHSLGKVINILRKTELKTIFCSEKELEYLNNIPEDQIEYLETVVSLDEGIDPYLKLQLESKFNFLTLSGLVKTLQLKDENSQKQKNYHNFPKVSPDDIFTLTFKSNTHNNDPIGSLLSQRNICSSLSAMYNNKEIMPQNGDSYLSHLSYDNLQQRIFNLAVLYNGGGVGFIQENIVDFEKEFIRKSKIINSTIFFSLPSNYKKIIQHVQNRKDINSIKKAVGNKFNEYKKNSQQLQGQWSDEGTLKTIQKEIFGDSLRLGIIFGAPFSMQQIDAFKLTFSVPVIELYGFQEGAGFSFCTYLNENQNGHVGGVLVNQEFKLQSVPELEYSIEEKDVLGNKIPRGEILIRGNNLMESYYLDEELSLQKIDKNGWYHTGDIGEMRIDNSIQIIDRVDQTFKNSSGNFIYPIKLEENLLEIKYIEQIFVYGSPFFGYCIAIVYPNKSELENISSYEEGKQLILKNIEQLQYELLNQNWIQDNECVRDIFIEDDNIYKNLQYNQNQNNGNQQQEIQDSQNFVMRYLLRKKYQQNIDDMYPCIPQCYGDIQHTNSNIQEPNLNSTNILQQHNDLCNKCKTIYQKLKNHT